jgi:hypothetical protein
VFGLQLYHLVQVGKGLCTLEPWVCARPFVRRARELTLWRQRVSARSFLEAAR